MAEPPSNCLRRSPGRPAPSLFRSPQSAELLRPIVPPARPVCRSSASPERLRLNPATSPPQNFFLPPAPTPASKRPSAVPSEGSTEAREHQTASKYNQMPPTSSPQWRFEPCHGRSSQSRVVSDAPFGFAERFRSHVPCQSSHPVKPDRKTPFLVV